MTSRMVRFTTCSTNPEGRGGMPNSLLAVVGVDADGLGLEVRIRAGPAHPARRQELPYLQGLRVADCGRAAAVTEGSSGESAHRFAGSGAQGEADQIWHLEVPGRCARQRRLPVRFHPEEREPVVCQQPEEDFGHDASTDRTQAEPL